MKNQSVKGDLIVNFIYLYLNRFYLSPFRHVYKENKNFLMTTNIYVYIVQFALKLFCRQLYLFILNFLKNLIYIDALVSLTKDSILSQYRCECCLPSPVYEGSIFDHLEYLFSWDLLCFPFNNRHFFVG